MKVYVATYGYDREGDTIIGVFDTPEKAQKACDDSECGDIREVTEFELNIKKL